LILEKQDELRLLEERLDTHDETDPYSHTRHDLPPDAELSRKALLKEIEHALTSYGRRGPKVSR
jgi:hypothetical protein